MANTYTNLQFHLVFSTKHRVNWIYPALQPRLWNYMAGICRDLNMKISNKGSNEKHPGARKPIDSKTQLKEPPHGLEIF